MTLDRIDCRALALTIATAYAHGCIPAAMIGTTWAPRDENGRQWTERRCRQVLEQLLQFGYCSMHRSFTGSVVQLTAAGYSALDIGGGQRAESLLRRLAA